MVFYRRRLPHWQPQEKALFITWRLYGSLPATVARNIASKRQPRITKSCDKLPLHDKLDESFFAWDNRLDSAKFGPLWLEDPGVAKLVEKAMQEGESKRAALPPARLCGDAQSCTYIGEARDVPGTDHQGSERVHCPASEQNPGADRTGGCVSTRSRRDRLSAALASVSESIW